MSWSDTDPTESQLSLTDRVRDRPWLFGGLAVVLVGLLLVVLVVFQPQRLLYDEVVDDEFPTVDPATGADDETMDEDMASEQAADEGLGDQDIADGDAEVADGEMAEGDMAHGDADVSGGDGMAEGRAAEGDAGQGGSDAMTSDARGGPDGDLAGDSAGSTGRPTGPVSLAAGAFMARSRYTVSGTATVYELEDTSRTLRLEDFASTNGPSLFVYLTAADADEPDGELDADHVDLGALRGNVGNQNYQVPADVDLEVYDTVVIWCRPFSVAFGAADLVSPDAARS